MVKILIVDDEPDIVELVSYNLEREGFVTAKAYDGDTALRKIRIEKPDLIVLDLMLPGVGGLDICKRIRANPETSPLPIIMRLAIPEQAFPGKKSSVWASGFTAQIKRVRVNWAARDWGFRLSNT